ncbi:TLC domain-containing protein 4 [Sorex fumeus]|uniref:TLC domain-containing protein 4 n=1 Tax=Sorex fumeus TaxID=62283 RepID=UPI0024AC8AC9|nr:TLC domain-containing protein 4 [Sorex fumeus]XP_055962565.1 TLC domain-containing protein 4 [Sorex fumeus]
MDNSHITTTFAASFLTFQLLFHLVSSWFSAKVSTGFRKLSPQKKIEWNSRIVSTVHSLVVGILGLYILFFDKSKDDPLWGESPLVDVNISIASGYLFSDLVILLLNWEVVGDVGFVLHHCTSLYAFIFLLTNGVLRYIGNYRLLAELSSPFVNQRWFFEALKYPKFSKANIINGVLMMVVFFIVRVAAMPPFYYYVYSVYGTEPYLKLGRVIQYSWISSCSILDVMNIMWMIKISKGCIKVITLFRKENSKNRLQNGKLN